MIERHFHVVYTIESSFVDSKFHSKIKFNLDEKVYETCSFTVEIYHCFLGKLVSYDGTEVLDNENRWIEYLKYSKSIHVDPLKTSPIVLANLKLACHSDKEAFYIFMHDYFWRPMYENENLFPWLREHASEIVECYMQILEKEDAWQAKKVIDC